MAGEPQIVGLGGHGDTPEQTARSCATSLSLTGKARPRVMHVPTAVGDSAEYDRRASTSAAPASASSSHLRFFPWPPRDLRELALSQDAISIGGGNTANMLAIWRVHGFDRDPARGLGERRRPLRRERRDDLLVRGGRDRLVRPASSTACATGSASSPAARARTTTARRCAGRATASSSTAASPRAIAADDGVGLHYVGTELREVVTCRPGAAAYRVTRDGEERLEARDI